MAGRKRRSRATSSRRATLPSAGGQHGGSTVPATRPAGSQASGRKSEVERLKEQQHQLQVSVDRPTSSAKRRRQTLDDETDGESRLVSKSDVRVPLTAPKLSARQSQAGGDSGSPSVGQGSKPRPSNVLLGSDVHMATKGEVRSGSGTPPQVGSSEHVGSSGGIKSISRVAHGATGAKVRRSPLAPFS